MNPHAAFARSIAGSFTRIQRVKLNACLERPAAVNDLERLLRVDQALFAFFLFDTL
jgi:hypothetical protein